ncbi:MAG: Trm112 family protein [Burkholderiaceae bacterium]|nr:Trm112 family protein [Burkholderiaceae bacterium]
MDSKLLEILACPRSKQPLKLGKGGHYLICESEQIAYPIIDGIPYLLESSAIPLQKIGIADMPAPDPDPSA